MPILEGWEGKAWGPEGSPSTKRPFFEMVASGGPGGPLQKDLFGKMKGGGRGLRGPYKKRPFWEDERERPGGPLGPEGPPAKNTYF